MVSQTNGSPFEARVLIEVMVEGVPSRVNVWTFKGETYISFPPDTTEAQATQIIARGLGLIRPLDVSVLFREGSRRRRFIESD